MKNAFERVFFNGQRAARMWKRNGRYYEKLRGRFEPRETIETDEAALAFSAKRMLAPAPRRAPRDIKLDDFFETVFKLSSKYRKLSARSKRGYEDDYRNHVKPRLGQRSVKSVDVQDIIGIFQTMRGKEHSRRKDASDLRGYSEATIYSVQVTLSAIFRVAKDQGYRSDHPVADLPEDERIRQPKPTAVEWDLVYRPDELKRLVDAAEDARYKMIFRLAPETGFRVSEMGGLRRESIDFARGSITVRWQLAGGSSEERVPLKWAKEIGEKARTVYPSRATMQALREYVDERERKYGPMLPSAWLFPNRHGRATASARIVEQLAKAETKAGIAHRAMKFHVFRHTFATHLAENGWSLDDIAYYMGDSIEMVSKRYRHRVNEEARGDRMRQTWTVAYG